MKDLISRASAIDIVRFECGEWEGLAKTIIKRFEQLPSAQPEPIRLWFDHELSKEEYERLKKDCAEQPIILFPKESAQRWIPCSERLPEHGGRYLISVLDGINRRTTVAPYLPRCKAWAMNGRMAYWKVIAWMPLPEPAKEDDHETN